MRNQDKNDVTSILFHRTGRTNKEVFFKTPQNREQARLRALTIRDRHPSIVWVQCWVSHSNSFI